ncbi:hypothetical protein PsorP6_007519 [Peronosclerospora sorghi]|uniref:Uncharacterized protein n=1 Tax=Peronosclerospora sorghi TaxID=230839 RepID=A0ACC0W8N5_9STRA|nr:hypothetical protein PsorP6_007519 [Peronosclerospora sorghi]
MRAQKQECGDGMNFHEPDIVLKDNDLMPKIRIDPATAHLIYDQIHKDSDFLCSQGIMDYRLLMGIQSSEYFVVTSQLPRARRDLLFTQPATSQKMSRIFALSSQARAENAVAFNYNYPALIDVIDRGNYYHQRHNTYISNWVQDQRPVFNPDQQQDIRVF